MAQDENNNNQSPEVNSDIETQHGKLPEHIKNATIEETFLPESLDEQVEGETKGDETPAETTETTPAADDNTKQVEEKTETPAAKTEEPPVEDTKTTQNEEIVDKTTETLYAGKYKTVDELRRGIQELGGEATGVDDPKALEAVYKSIQGVYNRARQQETPTTPEKTEEPKAPEPWKMGEAETDELLKQVDWSKIENMGDVLKQLVPILFNSLPQHLPKMYPQQPGQPQMSPQEMAAAVDKTNKNTDALGFIEAKVPRLTTDQTFRAQFASHLAAGKKTGKYPDVLTRDIMTNAMKDFLKNAADMAAEAAKLDDTQKKETEEDKGAAAAPDGGGAPASTQPAPDANEDILGSIMGAKVAKDTKFDF